jgi:hypothetical protein
MNNREEMLSLLIAWENLPLLISDLLAEPQKIEILMDIAINSSHPKSWRAAWMANKIHDIKPDLIVPYVEKMIIRLKKETCNSKKREFLSSSVCMFSREVQFISDGLLPQLLHVGQ